MNKTDKIEILTQSHLATEELIDSLLDYETRESLMRFHANELNSLAKEDDKYCFYNFDKIMEMGDFTWSGYDTLYLFITLQGKLQALLSNQFKVESENIPPYGAQRILLLSYLKACKTAEELKVTIDTLNIPLTSQDKIYLYEQKPDISKFLISDTEITSKFKVNWAPYASYWYGIGEFHPTVTMTDEQKEHVLFDGFSPALYKATIWKDAIWDKIGDVEVEYFKKNYKKMPKTGFDHIFLKHKNKLWSDEITAFIKKYRRPDQNAKFLVRFYHKFKYIPKDFTWDYFSDFRKDRLVARLKTNNPKQNKSLEKDLRRLKKIMT